MGEMHNFKLVCYFDPKRVNLKFFDSALYPIVGGYGSGYIILYIFGLKNVHSD